jgi:hypothetical protein
MKTETYECQDTRSETAEQSAEALALIEQLGLNGQKQTATTEVRFPYRVMTDDEAFVYSQLCPEQTPVEEYSNGPIPLEVLKTIAYARSLKDDRIAYLEVWSASSKLVKDPVLIGRKSRYQGAIYILARWGEELLPLEVLIPDAEVKAELEKPCPAGIPSGRAIPTFYK